MSFQKVHIRIFHPKIILISIFAFLFLNLPCTHSFGLHDVSTPPPPKGPTNYDPEWGVLVLNSSKKNYRSGRPVNVAMAVLDDKGEMVCNAELDLLVIDQSGQAVKSLSTRDNTIIVNDACWSKDQNENPDFVTTFSLEKLGYYELRLTASTYNGTKTVSEYINIKNKKRFFFEREAASRINPEHMYDVRWDLKVEEYLSGYFVIKIPKDFEIILPEKCFEITENDKRKLKCPVDFEPQKSQNIEFKYKAPGKAPWVYEIGPAKLVDGSGNELYNEGRTWKIAVDPRIRFGAAQEFDADRVAFLRTDVLGTDKFVICYADISAGQCRVGTVSGTDVTLGAEAQFDADIIIGLATVSSTFGVCRVNDDEFVVVYPDDSDDDGWAQAATVSGTTISFGTPFEWQNADPEWVSCAGIASNKFVIAFNDEANSDTGTSLVCNTSGNTITGCGAENDYAATDYNAQYNASVRIGDNKFAVAFRSQDAPDDGYFVAGTVSGTTITFGAVDNFTSSPITDVRVCAPQDDDRFVSVYQYTSQLRATAATVSGTAVTAGAEADINSTNQNGESPGCTFISANEFLTAYEDEDDSQFGTAVLCRVDWSTRDITCQPHGQVFAPVQIGSSSVASNSEFRGMETLSGYGALTAKVVISYVEDADGDDGMVIVGNRAPLLGSVTKVD